MTTRIKLRRDTAANWISSNPILSAGEPGLETDTRKIKYGDGATKWRDLDYANSKIKGRTPIEVTTQDPESWVNIVGRPRNASSVTGVVYDSQGNVISLSINPSGSKNTDGDSFTTVTKFDTEGNVLWQKDLIGNNYTDGYGLDTDSQDNIYINIGQNGNYGVVFKIDMDGNTVWGEGYSHYGEDYPAYLVVDNDGHPVVHGWSYDPGSEGAYVMRLNKTTGEVMLNVRYYDDNESWAAITPQGMAFDSDNNVIICGSHYNGDNYQLIIQKLNGTDFTKIWSKRIQNLDQYNDMNGGGVALDGADNIYVTGSYYGPIQGGSNRYKMVVMKLDTSGVVQWSRDVKGECDHGGASIVVGPNDGNLYLASVSYTPVYRDDTVWYESKQTVALACYESSTGKVLWQNYLVQNQLSQTSPGDNINPDFDSVNGQTIDAIGDRIVVGGTFVPFAYNGYGGEQWGLPTGWVIQFPASGDNVDIGGWKLTTARIPGQFQSFETTTYNDVNYNYDEFEWGYENPNSYEFSDSEISYHRITQDSNTWTFDLKGDLNLPEDGDLTIHKKNIGWLNLHGFKYNHNESVDFQGVCVDPDGNSYAYGYNQDWSKPYVVKYSVDGECMWQMIIDDYYDGNVYGCVEAGAWDSTNNQLVLVTTNWEPSYNVTLVSRLDPQTGKVISNTTLDAGQKWLNVYDVQITSSGDPVVVGQTNGGFKAYTVTVNTGTSTDTYLDVLATDFTDGTQPVLNDSNWLISGTGIDGVQYLYGNKTNKYTNLTGTVEVGSGAQFDVVVTSGTYTPSVTAGQAGAGYKVNDRIMIPYNLLGGTDLLTHSLVMNVDSVDGGAILAVSVVTGTAAGADTTYTAVASQPTPGTGATFIIDKYLDSGTPVYNVSLDDSGVGYKVGDVLTIAGTLLGGVSPDNDVVVTVSDATIWGNINSVSTNGSPTPDMSTIRLYPNLPDNVDFTAEGTWQVGYDAYTDGFIWTPTWTKIIGLTNDRSADGEYFTSVALDPNDNVFVAMEAYDSNFYGGNVPTSAVIKLDGDDGSIIWSRCLYDDGAPFSDPLVGSDSEGNLIVSVEDWNYGRKVFKLDTNGYVQWRVTVDSEDVYYPYSGTVAFDRDDNIIITGEDDSSYWFINKIDTDGNMLFTRRLWLGQSSYQQEYDDGTRWTAVQGDHIWTAGTTYAYSDDYYNGFVAKLPLDGTGIDGFSDFEYTDLQLPFSRDSNPWTTGDYSDVVELHASSGITATAQTMNTFPESYFKTIRIPMTAPSAGGLVFSDGSRQDTSAQGLPQRRLSGGSSGVDYAYLLQLSDAGRHVLLTDTRDLILPVYNQVQYPVGTVITLVNTSGSTRRVYFNGQQMWIGVAGTSTTSYGANWSWLEIPSYDGSNMVTLLKIEGDVADLTGNEGWPYSRWIASGTNLDITD